MNIPVDDIKSIEIIAQKHGLPIQDPIQKHHYSRAMFEYATIKMREAFNAARDGEYDKDPNGGHPFYCTYIDFDDYLKKQNI